MSLFSKLFGGGAAPAPEPETYKGFAITAMPQKDSNGWRLGAQIELEGQTHHLIRADVFRDKDEADMASIVKAKQMIDEQGGQLFG